MSLYNKKTSAFFVFPEAEEIVDSVPGSLIHLGYRGSKAHGTYIEPEDPDGVDDIDLMGIYFAPLEHYFGLGRQDVKEVREGVYDCVFYEIRKFVGLLLKNNPNVLSVLWLPDNLTLVNEPIFEPIIKNREVFASKFAFYSFTGYAHSQLNRMTHFNVEAEYKLDAMRRTLEAVGLVFEGDHPKVPAGASKSDLELIKQYNSFYATHFSGFMGAKRKANVKKYGYDVKNAAHLIRLLRMCIEFLKTGEMIVVRPDAEELRSIKRGEWKLEAVKKEAEGLFDEAETAYQESNLPEKPDSEKAEKLLVNLLMGVWS